MMDLSRLIVRMDETRSTDDLTTHEYQIAIAYGQSLHWEVYHRFSEFLSLYDRLQLLRIEALPSPPNKMLGRPQTASGVAERRTMLLHWLRALFNRADVRSSQPFLDFIAWNLNVETIPPLYPTPYVTLPPSGRYQLADFQWLQEEGVLLTAHEEGTTASRLGIVWSLVERELAGSLALWQAEPLSQAPLLTSDLNGCGSNCNSITDRTVLPENDGSYMFSKIEEVPGYDRNRTVFYHRASGRLFVGLRNGFVDIYRVPSLQTFLPSTGAPSPYYREDAGIQVTANVQGIYREETLTLHTEAILSFSGNSSGKLLIVSHDQSIRLLNCFTLETICGGKLTKRLAGHNVTKGLLEEDAAGGRMFVGATDGSAFIYESHGNPPNLLSTIPCPDDIPSSRRAVTALALAGHNLLVARKYDLHIYKVGPLKEEKAAVVIMRLKSPLKDGRTIRAICVPRTVPLLILLHSHAMTLWNAQSGHLLIAMRAHGGPIVKGQLLEGPSEVLPRRANPRFTQKEDPPIQIFTGGCHDGKVTLWELNGLRDLVQPPSTLGDPDHLIIDPTGRVCIGSGPHVLPSSLVSSPTKQGRHTALTTAAPSAFLRDSEVSSQATTRIQDDVGPYGVNGDDYVEGTSQIDEDFALVTHHRH